MKNCCYLIAFFLFPVLGVKAQPMISDFTFNGTGHWQTPNLDQNGNSMALLQNGQLMVCGSNSVYRLNNNGTIDSTFGVNGRFFLSNAVFNKIDSFHSGLVVAGAINSVPALIILKSNGTPDSTYGAASDGQFIFNALGTGAIRDFYTYDPSYAIWMCGDQSNGSDFDGFVGVLRYLNTYIPADCSSTNTSATDGFYTITQTSAPLRIVVGGMHNNTVGLMRAFVGYGNNLPIDSTFNANGIYEFVAAQPTCIHDLESNSVGETYYSMQVGNGVLAGKLKADGTSSSTYSNNSGFAFPDCNGTYKPVIHLNSDGTLLFVDRVTTDNALYIGKLNAIGNLDPSFGNNGVVLYKPDASPDLTLDVLQTPDGKILISGQWNYLSDRLMFVDRFGDSVALGISSNYPDALKLEVFPNPVNNMVQLNFTLEQPAKVSWEISDMAGRIVKRKNSEEVLSSGQHKELADLSDLHSGCYVLTFQSGNNTKAVRLMK